MTAADSVYRGLGYEQSPLVGYLATTGGAALLGSLIYKMMKKDPKRGAAVGVAGGTLASAPFLISSLINHQKMKPRSWPIPLEDNPNYDTQLKSAEIKFPYYDPNTDFYNRPELGNGFLDSAIVPGAMYALLEDKSTLPNKLRAHVAKTLHGSGMEALQNGNGAVTIGDVANAGLKAGLGAAGSFVLGTMLGSKSPKTWAGIGGTLAGSLSLGKSLGLVR